VNIPFRFALNTTTNPTGRVFDFTTASVKNLLLESISASAAFSGTATARLAAAGIVIPTAKFWVVGLSITAWYSTDVGVRAEFGIHNTTGGAFTPLYSCVSTGVKAGGIQKTFAVTETGLYVPQSATLLPAFKVFNQTGTDGDVTLAGDLAILVSP
jgi:hypothetical protein